MIGKTTTQNKKSELRTLVREFFGYYLICTLRFVQLDI